MKMLYHCFKSELLDFGLMRTCIFATLVELLLEASLLITCL